MLSFLTKYRASSSPWMVFLSTAFVVSLAVIDGGVVNVALPILSQSFHVNFQIIQWVISAYLFAVCIMIPIAGKLSDRYSSRQFYMTGIIIFLIGSLLCSLAMNVPDLIIFRVIQGIGAACILANTQAILISHFPRSLRGRALGINSMIVACGAVVGPSLGGFLIQLFGWRSIFYINIPIGLLGYLGTFIYLKSERPDFKTSIDFKGMLYFAIALLSFLLLLNHSNLTFINYYFYPLLFLLLIFIFLFFYQEKKVESPFIALSLLRKSSFFLGIISMFSVNLILVINSVLLPCYLMNARGLSPAVTGLFLFIMPLFVGVFAVLSGSLGDKTQRFFAIEQWGVAIFSLTLIFMALYNLHTSYFYLILTQSVLGIGVGIYLSPNNVLTLSQVGASQIGMASGLASFSRNFGKILGVALSSCVLNEVAFYLLHIQSSQASYSPEIIILAFRWLMIISFLFSVGLFSFAILKRHS